MLNELHERIIEENYDLIVVTETWFTSNTKEAEFHLFYFDVIDLGDEAVG